MGATKDKYLDLLDRLTEAGKLAAVKPDPLPSNDELLALARHLAADLGVAELLADVDRDTLTELRDAYNDGRKPDHLSFDAVGRELAKLGIESETVHTSGGCATLYAGPKKDWPDADGIRHRCVSLGPGSFSDERSGVLCGAYGLTYELNLGPIDEEYGDSVQDGAMPADVAAAIAAHVKTVVARRARLEYAVEKGMFGLWGAVAEAYPEVETGDFGPGETLEIERAIRGAVELWLYYNTPDEGLAPTLQGGHEIVERRRQAAIARLTPYARIVDSMGAFALGDLVRDAANTYIGEQVSTRDFSPISDDNADRTMREATDHRIDEADGVAGLTEVLVDLLGAWRAEKLLGAVELSVDHAEQAGLDGTGRDGNERFPYTVGNLTAEERERLLGVMAGERCRTCGDRNDDGEGWDGECGNCADRTESDRESNA